MCLALASLLAGSGPTAKELFQKGQKAERDGDIVEAYLLYSQAAGLEPTKLEYWAKSQSLRTRAALQAKPIPRRDKKVEKPTESTAATEPAPPGYAEQITDKDLEEVRRLKPPPDLKPSEDRRDLDLRGNTKALYERVAKMWGLDTVFDGDFEAGAEQRLSLEQVDFRGAIRALDAATGSFIVPLSEKLFLVVKDTQVKRREMEPTVAVTIPILDTVTPQEAQELARAVQQSLDITKLAIDTTRRMVLIRDRISKVRPAQLIFEQLGAGRPQVAIEVQFLEVNRSAFLSYGFLLPTQFPIYWLGSDPSKGAVQSLARFLTGHTVLGLGIANASAFARMSDSQSKILLHSLMRSSDGQPATFHVGDKYPIVTGALLGSNLGIPPSFNFEDLGLVLKVTPRVHGLEEVTLEVEAEFKVLGGEALNGIPIISSRKFQSKVRLKNGEWGLLAGMMNTTEARTITGLPGLSQIPGLGRFLRQNDRDRNSSEVVLLLKPQLLSLPPSEIITRGVWVGSETRMNIPLL